MVLIPNNTIIKDYIIENETFKRIVKERVEDMIEVEVGDIKQPDFKPQFKIKRWDNEVNFSIRAIECDSAILHIDGNNIKYITDDYEVHQYEKPEMSVDGGFEFEWVLPKKPKSNVLRATIETKELDFFYQPELTEEEIKDGVERPENIIGSYAAYHKTKKNNVVGGKEYKTGKVFHIYRPQAIDSTGNKIWCKLNIDKELTVTIPQDFLENANYPIVVDPTFGYTTGGGTAKTLHSYDYYSKFAISEPGTVISISAYTAEIVDATITQQVALYNDIGSRLTIDSIEVTTKDKIFREALVPNVSIGVGDYWMGMSVSGTRWCYYDVTTAPWRYTSSTGANMPSTLPGSDNSDRSFSIYATYTVSSLVGSLINIGDDFKVIDSTKVNIGDSWKNVESIKINIGGVWKDAIL